MADEKLKKFTKIELVKDSEGIIERMSKDDPKRTNILMTREQADELNSQQHNSKFLFKEDGVDYKLEDFRAGANSKGEGGKLIRMFTPDYEALDRKAREEAEAKAKEEAEAAAKAAAEKAAKEEAEAAAKKQADEAEAKKKAEEEADKAAKAEEKAKAKEEKAKAKPTE